MSSPKTKSLCPVCLKVIDASYVNKLGSTYLDKKCEVHGSFSTIIAEDALFFNSIKKQLANNPVNNGLPTKLGCPFDCGICEAHKQHTCCVLLEVTGSCNLNCPICFASSVATESKERMPTLAEISKWYDILMEKGGPFNIQLSGGEPTVRDDLAEIIETGKRKGFEFFQLNTNGIRIANDENYLLALKKAGLNTVFLQFDGFLKETYIALRGENLLETKLKALKNCKKYEIGVVLVPTIKKNCNDKEIGEIVRFAMDNIPTVRGIHFQPLSYFGRYSETPTNENRTTLFSVVNEITRQIENIDSRMFSFGGAEHYYCSFSGNFFVENNKLFPVKTNTNDCCSSEKSRKVVARKWTFPGSKQDNLYCENTASLDDFIKKIETSTITISCMAFQDVWNVDIERLQRCYIQVVGKTNKLIPFCAYNLTSIDGKSIYR